jgi:hypothetical protein
MGFISKRPPRIVGVPSDKRTRPRRLDRGRVGGAYRGGRYFAGVSATGAAGVAPYVFGAATRVPRPAYEASISPPEAAYSIFASATETLRPRRIEAEAARVSHRTPESRRARSAFR